MSTLNVHNTYKERFLWCITLREARIKIQTDTFLLCSILGYTTATAHHIFNNAAYHCRNANIRYSISQYNTPPKNLYKLQNICIPNRSYNKTRPTCTDMLAKKHLMVEGPPYIYRSSKEVKPERNKNKIQLTEKHAREAGMVCVSAFWSPNQPVYKLSTKKCLHIY